MPNRSRVLVAIMNNVPAFERARDEHWYHIPVDKAEKWVGDRWPPQWLAFYVTKEFGNEAHAVRHYARVREVRRVLRGEILRDKRAKARVPYYQLMLDPLEQLPRSIPSRRSRKINFIPTTWAKFTAADEINDLFDESPLEDLLWTQLKRRRISAERQEFVDAADGSYALDFAIYCVSGKLDVETDGDEYHANPTRSQADNVRNNYLETKGWRILRFTTAQIRERMTEECIERIVQMINQLGGLDEGRVLPRRVSVDPLSSRQLELFDD